MTILSSNRVLLCLSAVSLLLAGCGEKPATTGTIPGSVGSASGHSWMTPEARSKDLAYVGVASGAYILSYPDGELEGDIGGISDAIRLCGDNQGNIYIVSSLSAPGTIYEYARGGSQPIRILDDPYGDPWDCAVDSLTGNLAVTNQLGPHETHGNVVVYANATGKPQVYGDKDVVSFLFCGYDDQGNLFVDATGTKTPFLELANGAGALTSISFPKHLVQPNSVQWDGKYITVADFHASSVYRVKVTGSSGTVVSTTRLQNWNTHTGNVGSWIESTVILAPTSPKAYKLGIWKYPSGGKPTAKWAVKRSSLSSVFVSHVKHS